MTEAVALRPATARDAKALAALVNAAFRVERAPAMLGGMDSQRRRFMNATAGLALAALARPAQGQAKKGAPPGPRPRPEEIEHEEEISAPEDLMREHGVLNRILLIYEEGLRRLRAGGAVDAEVFHKPATLVRGFVEDYHEHLEETFIFPRFKSGPLAELAVVLKKQHDAGRRVTDVVLQQAVAGTFSRPEARQEVMRACEAFIRMYRPHEAREDTVLFPALYRVVGAREVKELGDHFEAEERRRFGAGGFEKAVEEVAGIEKQLGIADLDAFTPR